MKTQLPNDCICKGYKQIKPFHHEQVFHSPSNAFTGTEREFVKAGLGYAYVDCGDFKRVAVSLPNT